MNQLAQLRTQLDSIESALLQCRDELRRLDPVPVQDKAARYLRAVCREYEVHPEAILGPMRTDRVVEPRHVLCWLLHRHTDLTAGEIAVACGRHDHGSATWAIRRVEERMETEAAFARRVAKVERDLMEADKAELTSKQ